MIDETGEIADPRLVRHTFMGCKIYIDVSNYDGPPDLSVLDLFDLHVEKNSDYIGIGVRK